MDMNVQELSSMTTMNEAEQPKYQHSTGVKLSVIIKIILLAAMVHVSLSILSFIIIENRVLYEGPLQQHLPIHSGEIHYARIPKQYWEHRVLMLKAMGLNSLSVYVMWNYHEVQPGQFDFTSENKHLAGFLQIAKRHQMKVLLRPGPYVCAQWDFGGLPARFLGMDEIQIRSTNSIYENEGKKYFSILAPIIKSYLYQNGGPIIMIQIQNQLGYLRSTPQHSINLLNMWKSLGIFSQFYYEDPGEVWQNNYWQGAHIALSESSNMLKYLNLQLSLKRSKSSFIFGGEVYSGWFTDWGDSWARKNPSEFSKNIRNIINQNRSVNLYMGFGGSNFAMTAGANGFNPLYSYSAHVTSYDYDSPISEEGKPTEKYHLLRDVFNSYYGESKKSPSIPQPFKTIAIKDMPVTLMGTLFANLGEPTVKNGNLTYFQSNILKMYNQGLVLYQTTLYAQGHYTFKATIRDYAIIFVDQTYQETFRRSYSEHCKFNVNCNKAPCILKIFVEAMGHINFGKYQGNDRKGIIDFVNSNNSTQQYKWNIYKFPLDENILKWNNKSKQEFPALFKGEFSLSEVGDTFVDMSKWGKGYLWVNGRNLGRYWSIGPQYRLYCPGVWLKQGKNQLFVLQLTSQHGNIEGFETMS